MGLAPGGSIKQDIYEDEYSLEDWDLRNSHRCFVTLANATQWMDLTGEAPPLLRIRSIDINSRTSLV